ncbi:hypothetical protein QL285_085720 [Trifolium repens]|nr:hypothetical protein QL285_085720 [Trifolium repens]
MQEPTTALGLIWVGALQNAKLDDGSEERRKKAGVMSLSLLLYSFLFPVKKFEKLFSNSATNHQSMQVLSFPQTHGCNVLYTLIFGFLYFSLSFHNPATGKNKEAEHTTAATTLLIMYLRKNGCIWCNNSYGDACISKEGLQKYKL